ncbi:hypothetical protein GCM10012286_57680 [Streptomyces lasiicapitis]|uniref:Uncharacterized protein n=1 Tax=Streptomyces lasiicapitis TaxID=1923961 RepID=A0ABQ2MIQ8_9ACTN|nr:hypothetical protein GCM10012286_57680 [Streptomyces lasiicapitis]
MAFGKRRGREEGSGVREEAPLPAVEWADVREFTIGTVERPVTKNRPRPVRGPWAIRVPKGAGAAKVFAPCAYVARAAPPAPPSAMESCLYEDPDSQHLLCYLVTEEKGSGERCFRVYVANGKEIGVIRRIPPSNKLVKHTWRIDQPGHPEIVGRNEWISGGAKRIADRAAGKVVSEALNSLPHILPAGENTASGDSGSQRRSRQLEWWSGGELVMVSQSIKMLKVKADWLDRRLAFAFAVIGDS